MKPNNPFLDDRYVPGCVSMEGIHEGVFQELTTQLERWSQAEDANPSRLVALLAPRAGFGKSHLIARLTERGAGNSLFVPLQFEPETAISRDGLTRDFLDALKATPLSESDAKRSLLDLVARGFFAQMVNLGIERGFVEVSDPEASKRYLTEHCLTLFDPHAPDAFSRVSWFCEAFESLLEEIAEPLSQRLGVERRGVDVWARFFFDHTYSRNPSGAHFDSRERFRELGCLVAAHRPMVFVADRLDGWFGDTIGGLRIAQILVELSETIPRSLTILSANQDLWKSLFGSSLPSALRDRLSWKPLTLETLSMSQAQHLIAHRISDQGMSDRQAHAFLDSVNLTALSSTAQENAFTPRTLIRYARRMWEDFDPAAVTDPMAESDGKTVPFPAKPAEAKQSTADLDPAEKLAAVAEAIRKQGVSRVHHEVSFLVPPSKEGTGTTLSEVYQSYRLQSVDRDGLSYDAKKVFQLLREIGRNFSTISQTELEPPLDIGGEALQWDLPGREILLGFAPHSNERFWRNLASLAQSHQEKHEAEDPGKTWVKLALLSPHDDPFPLERHFSEVVKDPANHVIFDPIEVNRELLASLLAAADFLAASQSETTSASPNEVSAFLASELDYFWKKLTRKTHSSAGKAATG